LRPQSPSEKQPDQNKSLRTERQIELHRKRVAVKREEAEQREADARAREADARAREAEARAREAEAEVRHLNFGLVERIGFFGFAMVVGVVAVIGALSNPDLLKVAAGAGGLGGAAAVARYRWVSKRSKK